jgi:hypothetical protein
VTGAGKGQDTTSRRATRTEGRFDGFNLAAGLPSSEVMSTRQRCRA